MLCYNIYFADLFNKPSQASGLKKGETVVFLQRSKARHHATLTRFAAILRALKSPSYKFLLLNKNASERAND